MTNLLKNKPKAFSTRSERETLLRNLPAFGSLIIPYIPEGCLQRDTATSILSARVGVRSLMSCALLQPDITVFIILFNEYRERLEKRSQKTGNKRKTLAVL